MSAISDRLNSIPEGFTPLREHAERYVRFGVTTDEAGAVSIGHNPKVAPEYFVFSIFPPAHTDWLARHRSYQVPSDYIRFLTVTNGCFAYGMSLYGFTPTMQAVPALLSRSRLQCHDLTTANEKWITGFRPSQRLFHFGSRHYSHTENVGYFMEESGSIRSLLKSGSEVQRWSNFRSFLHAELTAAEAYNQQKNPI